MSLLLIKSLLALHLQVCCQWFLFKIYLHTPLLLLGVDEIDQKIIPPLSLHISQYLKQVKHGMFHGCQLQTFLEDTLSLVCPLIS